MPNDPLSDLRRHMETFLADYKICLDTSARIVQPRKVNDETIKQLGYTALDVINVLYSLAVIDYCAGPKDDKLHGGVYWEFGKMVEGHLIYIKLKLHTKKDGSDIPYCYSFHISDSSMSFPLK